MGIVFNFFLGGAANHEPGWGDRIENLFKIKFPMMTIRQWLKNIQNVKRLET